MILSDSLPSSPSFLDALLGGKSEDKTGQFRCFKTKNCAHFTYFMEDKGCHLQNSASTMVYLPGSIAGDAMCTEEEGEGEVRGTHAESAADWKARCHSV